MDGDTLERLQQERLALGTQLAEAARATFAIAHASSHGREVVCECKWGIDPKVFRRKGICAPRNFLVYGRGTEILMPVTCY